MLLIVGAALALAALGLAARRALVFRAHKPSTSPTHQATSHDEPDEATSHDEPDGRQAKASSAAAPPVNTRGRVAGVLKPKRRVCTYRQFDEDVDERSGCVGDDVVVELAAWSVPQGQQTLP